MAAYTQIQVVAIMINTQERQSASADYNCIPVNINYFEEQVCGLHSETGIGLEVLKYLTRLLRRGMFWEKLLASGYDFGGKIKKKTIGHKNI